MKGRKAVWLSDPERARVVAALLSLVDGLLEEVVSLMSEVNQLDRDVPVESAIARTQALVRELRMVVRNLTPGT